MDPTNQTGPIDVTKKDPLGTLANAQEKPDPLQAVPLTPPVSQDEEAISRRASMYAFGTLAEQPAQEGANSIFDVYRESSKNYRETIRTMGDEMIRMDAEQKAGQQAVAAFTKMAQQAPDTEAYNLAVRGLSIDLAERAQQKAQVEAERKWAESVASLRDSGRISGAELSIMAHDTPDVMDSLIDMQTIRAMLMRKMEDAQVNVKDRNWLLWATDALMYVLPFGTTAAHTNTYDANKKDVTDPLFPGRRFNEETGNAWSALLNARTNDERQAIVDKVWDNVNRNVTTMFGPNELLRLQLLHEYSVTPSADWMNLEALLQNGPTLSAGALKLGKIGLQAFNTPTRITGVLKGFGATSKNVDLLTEFATYMRVHGVEEAVKKYGMSADEFIEGVLPDALNPYAAEGSSIGAPVSAADKIARGEKLFKELAGELQTIERLSEEERWNAVKDLAERAKKYMISDTRANRTVVNLALNEGELANASRYHMAQMTIGKAARKGDNPWYATEASAAREAKRLGIEDAAPEEISPGQWGIKIRLPIDEVGGTLKGMPVYSSFKQRMMSGPLAGLAKFLSGGKVLLPDELHGAAGLSFDKLNKINNAIKKNILPTFHKLDNQDKSILSSVLIDGERAKVWYDDTQLRLMHRISAGPNKSPDKFIAAYHAARDINDIDYYLRNSVEFLELHTQGYQQIKLDALEDAMGWVNGKVFRNVTALPDEAIWNVEEGFAHVQKPVVNPDKPTLPDSRLTLQKLQEMTEQGYVIVRTHEPQKMVDGSMVRYFLVKGDNLKTDFLGLEQIPYYPGGHRMYRANYFVKMGRSGEQPWGETYFDTPFTPTAALTRAEGAEWASVADKARLAYKEVVEAGGDEAAQLNAIEDVFEHTESALSYPEPSEFLTWMKQNGHNNPFEVVYDRELPSMYSAAANGKTTWGDDLSGVNTYMQTQGRMFVSRKGPTLRNVRDWENFAETYDPFQVMNESLRQIAKVSSFVDYKMRSVNKWAASYRDYLDAASAGMSPIQMFLKGTFRSGTKDLQSIKQAAEAQRAVIKRTLGWKTDFDLGLENAMRQTAEWVAGDVVGPRAKAAHASFDWWAETKPVNALMGLSYDATMGLFNIAQFPLQVQTSLAAASIDAKKGAQAMANLPGIMLWMRKAADENTLKFLIERGFHVAAGFDDPAEYMAMMQTLKRTGFLDNMLGAIKNEFGPNAAMGGFGKTLDDLRTAGRFFTDKAEEVNRMTAWQMAWRITREKYPDMDITTPAFVERVRSLSSTFILNMDEAGAAAWQRNPLTKLPTQFMAYMARWHELVFGRELTNAQKLKFVAGQAFLYGTAGLPVMAYIAEEYQNKTGTTPEIGTLEGFASRGFADTMLWYATGMDLDFSSRAGIGLYPSDLIKEFFGASRYGESSAATMLLGPTGQIFGTLKDASFEAFKYAILESGGESNFAITDSHIQRIARSISTLNNIYKAEAIFKYGQYTNRKGENILGDIPSSYGWAALLGINPAEFRKQSTEMAWMEDRKKAVDEWVEIVQVQRVKLSQAIKDENWDEARQLGEDINFISRNLIPKDIKRDVFNKAYQDPRTQTVADSIGQRYDELRNKDNLAKRNTQ